MAVRIKDLVILAVAFIISAIMFPIAMQQVVSTATTVPATSFVWNSAFVTLWQVLLPVLVIVGIAITYVLTVREE